MSIQELIFWKYANGGELTELEKEVSKCLAQINPKRQRELEHEWDQMLLEEELGETRPRPLSRTKQALQGGKTFRMGKLSTERKKSHQRA